MWLVLRWLDGEEMSSGCLGNGIGMVKMLMGFGGGCCLEVVMLESIEDL
jgi:hypothetical protein